MQYWTYKMSQSWNNCLKPILGLKMGQNGPILGPVKFFPALWPPLSTRYCYSKLWCAKSAKINVFWTRKWPKTSFWPFFGPNWPIFWASKFFSALRKQLGIRYHYSQSYYAKSPKTNDLWTRKWPKTSF